MPSSRSASPEGGVFILHDAARVVVALQDVSTGGRVQTDREAALDVMREYARELDGASLHPVLLLALARALDSRLVFASSACVSFFLRLSSTGADDDQEATDGSGRCLVLPAEEQRARVTFCRHALT